jgi:hypothetical protein
MIRIADGLEMDPSAAATQTFAAIAAKGKGKTYLVSKFAEELFDASCPVIVLDPVGNWWALRLDADGKSPGLAFAVIGGEHGDVPLDPSRGADVARFLVQNNASAVIDVSELSISKSKEFVADFGEALFREARKARSPRMVIFEEAQTFAPQNAARGEERMLGAVTKIVRLGRNYGLGSMLVTQRPQSVHKEVLNLVECLFVGGLRGPHERKAITGWITEQGVDVAAQMADLPTLAAGEFYCWSPSWLRVNKRVTILPKRTFDGSSTPTLGLAGSRSRKELAPVDVEALRALLGPAPADDHGQLDPGEAPRQAAEIGRLEGELASAVSLQAEADYKLETLRRKMSNACATLRAVITDAQSVEKHLLDLMPVSSGEPDRVEGTARLSLPDPPPAPEQIRARGVPSISRYADELLGVIATHGPLNRAKLSLLSGKSKKSSLFSDALRTLQAATLISLEGGYFRATAQGRAKAKAPAVPTGRALYDYWCNRLGRYELAMFKAVAGAKRAGLTRAAISELTGASTKSSQFSDTIRRLKTLGLFQEVASSIRLSDDARQGMGL